MQDSEVRVLTVGPDGVSPQGKKQLPQEMGGKNRLVEGGARTKGVKMHIDDCSHEKIDACLSVPFSLGVFQPHLYGVKKFTWLCPAWIA